jgi:hypothetical protein
MAFSTNHLQRGGPYVFEAEPAGDQELREGGRSDLQVLRRPQFLRQFRHGDVAAGCDNLKDKVPVKLQFAVPEAAARTRINRPRLTPQLHQVHGEGHRGVEVGGRLVARMPRLNVGHHTFTQVVRQRMRHGKSPPQTLNHPEADLKTTFDSK